MPRHDGATRVSATTDAPAMIFGPSAGEDAGDQSTALQSLVQAALTAEAGPGMTIEVQMVVLDEPPEVPVPGVHPMAPDLPADRLDPAPDAPLPPRRPNAG